MNQAHHDRISVRAKLVEANKRRLELEENDKKRQGEMLELRRTMQIAIATVRTGGERFGRENAVQKIENTDKKVPLARSEQIWFVKNTKHKRDLNDRQQIRLNVDLQSLASSAIKELKDIPTQSILPADNISRGLQSQSPAGCVENTCISRKLFKDCSPPLAPAPVPLASTLASTPAMVIYRRFDIDHELKLFDQSPGCGNIPSKLCGFNHAFLGRFVVGGSLKNSFWKDMQLTLTTAKSKPTKEGLIGWSHVLKIYDDRHPYPKCTNKPTAGKHGALLSVSELFDDAICGMIYPTFLITVDSHALYIGQYRVVKRHFNSPNEFKFDSHEYLWSSTRKGFKFVRAKTPAHESYNNTQTRRKHRVDTVFSIEIGVRTSWTVLQFVGFDLESYEKLPTKYSQTEPFCRRKRLPLVDVECGFEHTL